MFYNYIGKHDFTSYYKNMIKKYDEKTKIRLYNQLVQELIIGGSERATYEGADRKTELSVVACSRRDIGSQRCGQR